MSEFVQERTSLTSTHDLSFLSVGQCTRRPTAYWFMNSLTTKIIQIINSDYIVSYSHLLISLIYEIYRRHLSDLLVHAVSTGMAVAAGALWGIRIDEHHLECRNNILDPLQVVLRRLPKHCARQIYSVRCGWAASCIWHPEMPEDPWQIVRCRAQGSAARVTPNLGMMRGVVGPCIIKRRGYVPG